MAQTVKNPPAMRATLVRSLGWEDPLEKGKATHSSILAWRIPRDHKELDTTERLSLSFLKGLLDLSVPQFPYLQIGANGRNYLLRFL